jgi:hypothetical protein
MPKRETLTTRVDRVERWIEVLAEKQAKLDDMLVVLTEAQIKLTQAQNQDRAEARERERRLDERIDKLVGAIGELIRRNGGKA